MRNCISLISLPKIHDNRGNLTYIEEEKNILFKIKRIYWIYDVPGGQERGGHAFYTQHEVIVALSGSFDVITHDGKNDNIYSLNRSYMGLYIPPLFWRQMSNFSTNSVALVLSSTDYDEKDYLRDFEKFMSISQHEFNRIRL